MEYFLYLHIVHLIEKNNFQPHDQHYAQLYWFSS